MARLSDYLSRIKAARARLQDDGIVPEGLLPEPIERSWSRLAESGQTLELNPKIAPLTQHELDVVREQNTRLLHQARPEMETLHAQIVGTQSMVILTDAQGTILHALGDAAFINKAQRVALRPGVSWSEENTGTNAIGTALVEQAPVMVMGAEHYYSQNTFLNCSAAPILDPHGQTIGVLDVSGDYRQPPAHTMALVRMSAQMIENRLFNAEFAREITLHFHARSEFIGSLWEGIAVFSPEGKLLAINRNGGVQLGLKHVGIGHTSFEHLFDAALASVLSQSRKGVPVPLKTTMGRQLFVRVNAGASVGLRQETRVRRPADQVEIERPALVEPELSMLDLLDSGDPQLRKAIERIRKVLRRDIPILVEGETGTGKELLAKAIHLSSGRKGVFVAINCASIPEGLIEAELFGYEEGAFTGAKRNGVPGKILQANGGTLFLDEIGEMPLSLQARLLRVLQDREVVPLGGGKATSVDFALVSATNRKLLDRVEQGYFREDLYYRLNGLRVTLPPLRERQDLEVLVARILDEEAGHPVELHEETLGVLRRHPWRGNVRQLRNVLRAALAFVERGEVMQLHHLPEDFIEEEMKGGRVESQGLRHSPSSARFADEAGTISEVIRQCGGNMTEAAKQLGIGRATLYRKVKQLQIR
jgi:transcriptional regulator of acetoin/glycerol metabolism